MRVMARSTIVKFLETLAGKKESAAVKGALSAWFYEATHAKWRNSQDVKLSYSSASIVGDRVVFNIKGNDYRLVTAMNYKRQIVFIKWVGTHADYDKIDVRTVEYGDQAYQKRPRS